MLTHEPVVQIHASRFCNYTCLHCYSSSSPLARDSLSVDDILSTTRRLAGEGYRRASLSGGEPVLYRAFENLAKGLSDQGFTTSVITNGTRPEQLLVAMRAGVIHHASVSFDGAAELHDKIRNKKGAFARAITSVGTLVDAEVSTGVVLSVTQQSFPQLPDLVERLVNRGIMQVQLHPLAAIGRATRSSDRLGPELSQEALLRLILLTLCLRKKYPDVSIRCDAVTGSSLPAIVEQTQGALISPIVIRDDGQIVPYAYDVSTRHSLGRVAASIPMCRMNASVSRLLAESIALARGKLATTVYREIVACSQTASSEGHFPRA